MSDSTEIANAVRTLRKGGTILYPTDTVWGIGCDATNRKAVEMVYRLKDREEAKSLIILAGSIEMLKECVTEVPPAATDLMAATQKPLTVIYPHARNLAPNVPAPDGSVAVRVTRDGICRKIIAGLGRPLVSTSANVSGQPPPLRFREIAPRILDDVDYVVNLRTGELGGVKPSTIIRIRMDGSFEVVRE